MKLTSLGYSGVGVGGGSVGVAVGVGGMAFDINGKYAEIIAGVGGTSSKGIWVGDTGSKGLWGGCIGWNGVGVGEEPGCATTT